MDNTYIRVAGRKQVDILAGKRAFNHFTPVHQFHVGAAVVAHRYKWNTHCGSLEPYGHTVVCIVIHFDHPVGCQVSKQGAIPMIS